MQPRFITAATLALLGGIIWTLCRPGGAAIDLSTLAAMLGAATAGFGLAPLLGRRGILGWALALIVAIAATISGSLLAMGLLMLIHQDPNFVHFGTRQMRPDGVVFLWMLIVSVPFLTLPWLGTFAGLHWVIRRQRLQGRFFPAA